jgi:hypothetical protein
MAARPGRVIAGAGAACALAYGLSLVLLPKAGGRVVSGDAVHYFVYIRSIVFDRDLRFQNDYMGLYGLTGPVPGVEWIFTPLPTGYVRNFMPIGSAIVWAPLYVFRALGAWLGFVAGLWPAPDGFSRAFQASAGFSGIAAATAGAWLSFSTARSIVDGRYALFATLAVWFGSSAVYYSLVSPNYSHANSMLATSLVLYAWWRTRGRQDAARYALLGASVGFAALVRWQDAVFLLVPAADLAWDLRSGPGQFSHRATRVSRNALACLAAAMVVFSPQNFAWWVIYGRPLLVPQGGDFMRWHEPHGLDVLFSTFRGLFTWTPIVAAALVGLLFLGSHRARVAVTLALVFLASWYANAAVADWWAGEAFGARRFVSCFPIFVIGLTALLARTSAAPALRAAMTALVGANLLLLLQYQLFLKGWRELAPYPDDVWSLWIERFLVPLRLVARLWR